MGERESSAIEKASSVLDRLAGTVLDGDANFLLARANAVSIAEGNRALAAHGLRARSYSVLALTTGERGPSQRELAEILRLDPSQVVALVDDLQGRGLVERKPAPADRRANVVIATEAGQQLLAQASASARLAERRVLEVLDGEERAQLVVLLRRVAFNHAEETSEARAGASASDAQLNRLRG